MVKLTLLYGHPADAVSFESYYAGTHLPLAAKITSVRRAEFSLVTGALGKWTWERGMKGAGTGWQVATCLMLATQLAFVCLGAATRI